MMLARCSGGFVVSCFLLLACDAADLISTDFSGTRSGNLGIFEAFAVNADGRFAAFASRATNHVAQDTNASSDTFVHDCLLGRHVWDTTYALSAPQLGGLPGSNPLAFTPDGRYLLFVSTATNLVSGIAYSPGFVSQLYVQDLASNITTLVSVSYDGAAAANTSVSGTGSAFTYPISSDGRFVGFMSSATNLVAVKDTPSSPDLFCRDLFAGVTELISVAPEGASTLDQPISNASMSTNGRYFAFETAATNVVAGLSNTTRRSQVYWRDRLAGTNALVSITADGALPLESATLRDLSSDGRYVCFWSGATNLAPNQNDQNGTLDTFIRDMFLGETWLVTRNTNGVTTGGRNSGGRFSANSERLLFSATAADLVPGVADANNSSSDLFVHYLGPRTNDIVSVSYLGDSGASSFVSDSFSRISSSGRFVLFTTDATNLIAGTTGRVQRLYLRDLDARRTLNPLRANSFPTLGFNEGRIAISESERYMFFLTQTNFDQSITDTNNSIDLFRSGLYPPKFLNSGAPGATLRADAVSGAAYVLQSSSNLTHWTAIQTNLASPDGQLTTSDPQPPSSPRFYRLLLE
jgi:hypothetical protein